MRAVSRAGLVTRSVKVGDRVSAVGTERLKLSTSDLFHMSTHRAFSHRSPIVVPFPLNLSRLPLPLLPLLPGRNPTPPQVPEADLQYFDAENTLQTVSTTELCAAWPLLLSHQSPTFQQA